MASVISSLTDRISPDAANIDNRVLKFFPKNLISYLFNFINDGIELHYISHSWILETVICIAKNRKPPQLPSNYRPISPLSPLTEKIFPKRLKEFTESNSLLPVFQDGFRKSHECDHQLHHVVDNINDRQHESKPVTWLLSS